MPPIPRARLEEWNATGRAWGWQRALLSDSTGELDASLQRMVAVGPAAVEQRLRSWLEDPDPAVAARAVVAAQALWLMRAGGSRVEDVWQDWGFLLLRNGQQVALCPEALELPDRIGVGSDVERLRRALDRVQGRWRMVVGLVEPVPAGVDPQPVARAVELWQQALVRGERVGRTAVYEDEGLSIDLALTERERADGENSLMLLAHPLHVEGTLRRVVARSTERLAQQGRDAPFVPVVMAVAANRAWRLSRRWMVEMFYGVPYCTIAARLGTLTHWEATIRRQQALFSEDAGALLAGMLFLDPQPGDVLGCKLWTMQNPWCEPRVDPSWSPGPGLQAREAGEADEVLLSWQDGRLSSWSPPP